MFFTKRKAIILIIICSIFFILTYNDVRSEEIKEISGNAQIIDGDTIKINSKKIRLYGIDAPEFKQMCNCLLYTSPSPRDLSTSRMPSSA